MTLLRHPRWRTAMIYILLATYNGARFLPELLASIRHQTYQDWRLLVRDDGSTDDTLAILSQAIACDVRVDRISDSLPRQGPTQNFGLLMTEALRRGGQYIFLADQDDVWLPHKLKQQLLAAERIEAGAGGQLPLLVHSDLIVVDERLQVRQQSFIHSMTATGAPANALATLLLYNHVTGCATMVNRALAQLALPFPRQAVMHDWWLALVAASRGCVHYLDQPTVLYRQHASNAVGARGLLAKLNPLQTGCVSKIKSLATGLDRAIDQAAALADHLQTMSIDGVPNDSQSLAQFLSIFAGTQPWWRRYHRLRSHGMAPVSPARRAILALRLLLHQGTFPVRKQQLSPSHVVPAGAATAEFGRAA